MVNPIDAFGLSQADIDENMIFIIDINTKRIEYASPMSHRNLGYGKGELIELSAYALHPHEMEELSNFIRAIQEKEKVSTDSMHCLAKNGAVMPAFISAEMQSKDGKNFMIARVVLKEK